MRFAHVAALSVLLLSAATASAIAPIHPWPVYPEPAPVGYQWQWVAPEYRTDYIRQWVAGYTYTTRAWVEVSPGKFEWVWREVTVPGHYEMVPRQVLIREGYWRLVRVPVYVPPAPPVVITPPPATVAPEGFAPGRPADDAGKFSPMYDWPK